MITSAFAAFDPKGTIVLDLIRARMELVRDELARRKGQYWPRLASLGYTIKPVWIAEIPKGRQFRAKKCGLETEGTD